MSTYKTITGFFLILLITCSSQFVTAQDLGDIETEEIADIGISPRENRFGEPEPVGFFQPFFSKRSDGIYDVLKSAKSYRNLEIADTPSLHLEDLKSIKKKTNVFGDRLEYSLDLEFNEKGKQDLKDLTMYSERDMNVLIINNEVMAVHWVVGLTTDGHLFLRNIQSRERRDRIVASLESYLEVEE